MSGTRAAAQPGGALGRGGLSAHSRASPPRPGLWEPQLQALPAATYLPNNHPGGLCMGTLSKPQINRTPEQVKNRDLHEMPKSFSGSTYYMI